MSTPKRTKQFNLWLDPAYISNGEMKPVMSNPNERKGFNFTTAPSIRKPSDICPSGIYIGERPGFWSNVQRLFGADRSVIIPSSYSGPMAIIGSSGSGKTSCVVMRTLCETYCAGNFFAIDLKGDLYPEYIKRNPDAAVKVLSLRSETDYTYEPFAFIRDGDDADVASNIRELANALIPYTKNSTDDFWVNSSREYLTAALWFFYDKELDGKKMSFIDAVFEIMKNPPTKLIKTIKDWGKIEAKVSINNFLGDAYINDSKLLMGIGQEITNRLGVIATDPRVQKALSPSEKQIKWADLEDCNIFLSVPLERLEQSSPVTTMLITQLIRSLECRHEKHSLQGEKQRPTLLMLDEFPGLGRIDVMTSAVSTLRSKNVTICLVLQSLAQLDEVYSRSVGRIIMDNCSYTAVFWVNDVESQIYFSTKAGTVRVERRSRNTSYAPSRICAESNAPIFDRTSYLMNTYFNTRQTTGYSETVTVTRENLIEPHEFATLRDIVLFTPDGCGRVKKSPYYKTDTVIKLRESIVKVADKVSSGMMRVVDAIKSFFAPFFGRKKRSAKSEVNLLQAEVLKLQLELARYKEAKQ